MAAASPLAPVNLHTHTVFSDGSFEPEWLVKAALEAGLSHIAITDHFATTKVSSVPIAETAYYLETVRALDRKYHDRVTVLAGVELDGNPMRCDHSRLPFELLNAFDLVLFEYIGDTRWGGLALGSFQQLLDHFTVPVGLAHTDLMAVFSESDLEQLYRLMTEGDPPVFVELSASPSYRRGGKPYYEYATDFLERLNGCPGTVSIGSDTHGRLSTLADVNAPLHFLLYHGLRDSLVTEHHWPRQR